MAAPTKTANVKKALANSVECAPGAGQVEVSDLTGCAGLSKEESHGPTAFAQH